MTENENVVGQLQKIIKVSTRIRQDQMRKILKMDEDTFNEQIINWADKFGFKIDGDYIAFGGGDTDAFIQSLDQQFAEWTGAETSKAGKAIVKSKQVAKPTPAASGTQDYYGTPLYAPDYDVLCELETLLGKQISIARAKDGHVTRLDLSNQGISSLPESIGSLPMLTTLDLRGNQLSSLPDAIGNLASLKILELYNNKLSSLPDSIGNLTSLQELWLNDNKLTSMPDTICNLQSLESLALQNNKLSSLPEAIGQLSTLHTLNLWDNKLTTLPESMGQLISLKTLNLNNNPLGSISEVVGLALHELMEHGCEIQGIDL